MKGRPVNASAGSDPVEIGLVQCAIAWPTRWCHCLNHRTECKRAVRAIPCDTMRRSRPDGWCAAKPSWRTRAPSQIWTEVIAFNSKLRALHAGGLGLANGLNATELMRAQCTSAVQRRWLEHKRTSAPNANALFYMVEFGFYQCSIVWRIRWCCFWQRQSMCNGDNAIVPRQCCRCAPERT